MGLVNELQISAEKDDVLASLRKTLRLSSKLSRMDIMEWVGWELNGYPNEAQVPPYRLAEITPCYNTNGPIRWNMTHTAQGIFRMSSVGQEHLEPIKLPISAISSMLELIKQGESKNIYVQYGAARSKQLRSLLHSDTPEILDRFTFLGAYDLMVVRDIGDQVKNRILDWACALEVAGVTGDDKSFSEQEKQTAKHVIFNIYNSTIEQLTDSGSNKKEGF